MKKKQPAVVTPAVKNRQKVFNTEQALGILKDFYREARKEIRKQNEVTIEGRMSNEACVIEFVADGIVFSLVVSERRGV
jgi:hypothetical protein